MRRLSLVAASGSMALFCACASAPAPVVEAAPAAPAGPELGTARLCVVTAEVQDAAARLRLRDTQARFERATGAAADKEARFAALLAIGNDQDRFRAFHDKTMSDPTSAVGPLGECFVYADWKMADQAQAPCEKAARMLGDAVVVDIAKASLARRTQKLAEAAVLVESALVKSPACAAAHMEAARVHEAAGSPDAALASWEKSLTALPTCATCAVEAARLIEAQQGRDASVPAWERALTVAPDHAEALKRYGAVLAGKDDAKALAAYERAIAAGVGDAQTYLGAAQLARTVDADKALAFAERALAQQKNDVDAWRLVLDLATKKNDGARAESAAAEVLRLVQEDVPAHLVLGRAAIARGDLVKGVNELDAAARAIAAGRGAPLGAAELEAAKVEHQALLKKLGVKEPGAKGSKEAVVASVRRTVQVVFSERLKEKKGLKGAIEVNVTTVAGGAVTDVQIEKDTLADPTVAASVVANLRRANIAGGPKRYGFALEFE